MKKAIIAMICIATVALGTTGCTLFNEEQGATEPATEVVTEVVTEAPTKAPTQAPTEAPTEPPTEAPTVVVEPENTTFSVTVEQPATEPPTTPPTQAPTVAQTVTLLKPIVGEWHLNYYKQSNGQQTSPGGSITYTFNTDGTFSVDNRGNVSTGTFYFDGTTISYKADASGEVGKFTYNATEKQLIDTDESSQMSAVFTRGAE